MHNFFNAKISYYFTKSQPNLGMHQEAIGRRKNYKEGVHEKIGNKSKKLKNIGNIGFVNI